MTPEEEIQLAEQKGFNCATTSILHFMMTSMAMQFPATTLGKLSANFTKARHNSAQYQELEGNANEAFNEIYDQVENALNRVMDHREAQAREGTLPEKTSTKELAFLVDELQGMAIAQREMLTLLSAYTFVQLPSNKKSDMLELIKDHAEDPEVTKKMSEATAEVYRSLFDDIHSALVALPGK